MTITVLHNQSLLDVCLQVYGTLTGLFALAYANGLSISSDLVAGAVLVVPNVNTANTAVVNYYYDKQLIPATAVTQQQMDDVINTLEGIDYWAIGVNFIIQ